MLSRAHKLLARSDGHAWAARREIEVRDVRGPWNGIFDASWVHAPDDITDPEDRHYYAYLTSAAAATAWARARSARQC